MILISSLKSRAACPKLALKDKLLTKSTHNCARVIHAIDWDGNTFRFKKRFLLVELLNDNCGVFYFASFSNKTQTVYPHTSDERERFIKKSLLEIPSRQIIIHVQRFFVVRFSRCKIEGKKILQRTRDFIFNHLKHDVETLQHLQIAAKTRKRNDVIYHLLFA